MKTRYTEKFRGVKMLIIWATLPAVLTAGSVSLAYTTKEKVNGRVKMKIIVKSKTYSIVYSLNNSRASASLYKQLPLKTKIEDYNRIEKIFYPPEKLETEQTPPANAKEGTLAYYAPWSDVVLFYKDFGKASGLYELGIVVSGKEHIKDLEGPVEITGYN